MFSKGGCADSSTVSDDERPFYQADDYYSLYSHPNTQFEKKVITFAERKTKSVPSLRGLFIGEILLLEYCSYGKYPKPASGYPGFWWFEYGIRDIGHLLESLVDRGFITWASFEECISKLKVAELKDILDTHALPSSSKKADLVNTIVAELPNDWSVLAPALKKYTLTELGKAELSDNGYVPYMHKHPHKTVEGGSFGEEFNVWSINQLFCNGDASNWKTIVGKIELDRFGVDMASSYQVDNKGIGKADYASQKDAIRRYLAEKEKYIKAGIAKPGDGFAEESQGLDYKRIGKDAQALVQFYIAIGKGFDAPALYTEAAVLLHKYEMYDEELYVISQGLKAVSKCNRHREELVKQKARVQEAKSGK